MMELTIENVVRDYFSGSVVSMRTDDQELYHFTLADTMMKLDGLEATTVEDAYHLLAFAHSLLGAGITASERALDETDEVKREILMFNSGAYRAAYMYMDRAFKVFERLKPGLSFAPLDYVPDAIHRTTLQ